MFKVALVGNPNSGKTSLFNALTGKTERVGNWAGVTVSKKVGKLKRKYAHGKDVQVIDLPGAYYIDAYTKDEMVALEYVKSEKPDSIINVIDALSLERGLYLTVELIKLGLNVTVAINKMDLARRKEIEIDAVKLSSLLGVNVFCIETNSRKGIKDLVASTLETVKAVK